MDYYGLLSLYWGHPGLFCAYSVCKSYDVMSTAGSNASYSIAAQTNCAGLYFVGVTGALGEALRSGC